MEEAGGGGASAALGASLKPCTHSAAVEGQPRAPPSPRGCGDTDHACPRAQPRLCWLPPTQQGHVPHRHQEPSWQWMGGAGELQTPRVAVGWGGKVGRGAQIHRRAEVNFCTAAKVSPSFTSPGIFRGSALRCRGRRKGPTSAQEKPKSPTRCPPRATSALAGVRIGWASAASWGLHSAAGDTRSAKEQRQGGQCHRPPTCQPPTLPSRLRTGPSPSLDGGPQRTLCRLQSFLGNSG